MNPAIEEIPPYHYGIIFSGVSRFLKRTLEVRVVSHNMIGVMGERYPSALW
jgi:hypothetical protein